MTNTTDKCARHLREQDRLEVRKSKIPNAGRGLFTLVARKEDDLIVAIQGTIVDIDDDSFGNEYVLQIGPSRFIDSSRTTDGAGRFANAIRTKDHSLASGGDRLSLTLRNNAEYRWDEETQQAHIVATQAIAAGSEIFVEYGEEFFVDGDEVSSNSNVNEEVDGSEDAEESDTDEAAEQAAQIVQACTIR